MPSILNMPKDPSQGVPQVNLKQFNRDLANRRWDNILQAIVRYLHFFESHHYTSLGGEDIKNINTFVLCAFAYLTDENSKCSNIPLFIHHAHIFGNLVSISDYEVTDSTLKHVLRQKENLFKILFLHNAHNSFRIPPENLFDINPTLASIWYQNYILGNGCPTELQQGNLAAHLAQMDERWEATSRVVSSLYFGTTYLNPSVDLKVKGQINKAIREKLTVEIKNTPNPKSICIISDKWRRNHAVYKSASPLVNQLMGHYKLTLVTLDYGNDKVMAGGFDKVVNARFDGNTLRVPPELSDNDFQLVYFPDVGMSDASIFLSNCRLAPIQAMGYGHPATSGGSEVDYFIGSLDVERDCADKYAEKLVLIPGLAQVPVWPSYEKKNNHTKNDKVRVNLVWGPDKANYTMLTGLAEISKRCDREHEYHFYPSMSINRYAALIPYKRDILKILPNAVFHTNFEYADYMESAEQSDVAINSFPFGGYNTVVESLYLGVPMATLEGDRFYNRACSWLLRKIGLPELTTTSPNEFVEICADLIERCEDWRSKLDAINLKEALFDEPNTHFLEAINLLIKERPQTSPIIIGEADAAE